LTLTNSVNANINTRGHRYTFFPHHSSIDVRYYVFTERVVHLWNDLSAEQRHFSSSILLKKFINSFNLSIYVSLGFSCCVFNLFLFVLFSLFYIYFCTRIPVSASAPRCSIITVHVICLLIDFHIYTCVL